MLKIFLDMAGKYGVIRTAFAFGLIAVAVGCGFLSAWMDDPVSMWNQFVTPMHINWAWVFAILAVLAAVIVWGDIIYHRLKKPKETK